MIRIATRVPRHRQSTRAAAKTRSIAIAAVAVRRTNTSPAVVTRSVTVVAAISTGTRVKMIANHHRRAKTIRAPRRRPRSIVTRTNLRHRVPRTNIGTAAVVHQRTRTGIVPRTRINRRHATKTDIIPVQRTRSIIAAAETRTSRRAMKSPRAAVIGTITTVAMPSVASNKNRRR